MGDRKWMQLCVKSDREINFWYRYNSSGIATRKISSTVVSYSLKIVRIQCLVQNLVNYLWILPTTSSCFDCVYKKELTTPRFGKKTAKQPTNKPPIQPTFPSLNLPSFLPSYPPTYRYHSLPTLFGRRTFATLGQHTHTNTHARTHARIYTSTGSRTRASSPSTHLASRQLISGIYHSTTTSCSTRRVISLDT